VLDKRRRVPGERIKSVPLKTGHAQEKGETFAPFMNGGGDFKKREETSTKGRVQTSRKRHNYIEGKEGAGQGSREELLRRGPLSSALKKRFSHQKSDEPRPGSVQKKGPATFRRKSMKERPLGPLPEDERRAGKKDDPGGGTESKTAAKKVIYYYSGTGSPKKRFMSSVFAP